MTGDAHSIGVVFGNLSGRNFDRKDNPAAEHREWLQYIAAEFNNGASLGMLSVATQAPLVFDGRGFFFVYERS